MAPCFTKIIFKKHHKIIPVVLICVPVHSQKYQIYTCLRTPLKRASSNVHKIQKNSYRFLNVFQIFSCHTTFSGCGRCLKKILNTACFYDCELMRRPLRSTVMECPVHPAPAPLCGLESMDRERLWGRFSY